MSDGEQKKITLPVAGARNSDMGKGSIIELGGKRTTPAIALGPAPEDESLDIIRREAG